MPAQPLAGAARMRHVSNERAPVLFKSPILRVTVNNEVRHAARKKMFSRQLRNGHMIHKDAGKRKLRTAKTEIHSGLSCLHNEIGQIIARPQPCQNAIPFPTPRNYFLSRRVWAEMPALLLRIL